MIGSGVALAFLLIAGVAQAQTTTFTYRELDQRSATVLARKTLGAHGESFVLLERSKGGGMIWSGARHFTFAETPKHGITGGCETRRAHVVYRPLVREKMIEPPQAKLKFEQVWFEKGFARLPNAPTDDGTDAFYDRMDRLCAKVTDVFDWFSAHDVEAAERAMRIVDRLAAAPAPGLECDKGSDCPALVHRVLTGRLFHVEQWDCGPLDGKLPAADVIRCQELRFDLEPHNEGHVGILRVRFREGTDTKTQTRVMTLQAVHAEEAHYQE